MAAEEEVVRGSIIAGPPRPIGCLHRARRVVARQRVVLWAIRGLRASCRVVVISQPLLPPAIPRPAAASQLQQQQQQQHGGAPEWRRHHLLPPQPARSPLSNPMVPPRFAYDSDVMAGAGRGLEPRAGHYPGTMVITIIVFKKYCRT